MVNKDYAGINIPIELAKKIDKIIDSKKYGYKKRAEFVKEAIREKLEYFKINEIS
jgi:metal-responsive CopG/Arc/MetJ family transcriptional regulator